LHLAFVEMFTGRNVMLIPRVWWTVTDISEECAAPNFTLKKTAADSSNMSVTIFCDMSVTIFCVTFK
jgi:hypothetical protein